MPRITLPTSGVDQSVTRPVVFDITRQLMDDLGISSRTQIAYPGDIEHIAQPGSMIQEPQEHNLFPYSEKLSITVDEQHILDRTQSIAVHRPEHLHIFRDDRIETYIKPVYSPMEVSINFTYRAKDKTQATRWRDDFRTRAATLRDQRVYAVNYYYLIPDEFIVILKELHRMREAVAGYGEDWETFFKANVSSRVSTLTTLAGTAPVLGVTETQDKVLGWFDFDGLPEVGSKEDDADTWTINFAYKFQYEKPIECGMCYPLVIHNQLVDERFRPTNLPHNPAFWQQSRSLSSWAFSQFESGNKLLGISDGIAIPAFDEFIPSDVVSGTVRVFTALVNLDLEPTGDPSYLLSLLELGDYEFHPTLVEFLIGELPYLCKPYQSVFVLSLYEGVNLRAPQALRVESDYKVYTTQTLDPRKYYHVRLSIVEDFAFLRNDAIDRLRENGPALLLILAALGYTGPEIKLILGRYVSREDMGKVIQWLSGMNGQVSNGQDIHFNTVMSLFIQVEGKLENAHP